MDIEYTCDDIVRFKSGIIKCKDIVYKKSVT